MEQYDTLIVGAGHGGAQTAIALRQQGFTGSIGLLGEESELPYERPPLSKAYLSGEIDFERILIRPPTFWHARHVALLSGRRVSAIDATARFVTLSSSEPIGYRQLIWAAGGYARRLSCSGHDFEGVHSVRSRADVDRMMVELPATRRVVVIGAGYLGLEAAAVLTKLGKEVTVLELQDRVLARVAGTSLSRFIEREHRAHGIDIQLGVSVDSLVGAAGRATGVRLSCGTVVPADMVIVCVGILPAVEPLRLAGARSSNGVAVDKYCRTSLPDIFAIGDCALHANDFAHGALIRLESVQNANDMATTVANTITGHNVPYHAVPWFWSNQFAIRLQTVGLSTGYDLDIVRGDISSKSFSIIYLSRGRVIALDCINATKD